MFLRKWSQVLCTLIVALLIFEAGLFAYANDEKTAIERFKIAQDGDALLVPVNLSGKTYLFIVDTGFTATAFDRGLLTGEPLREVKVTTASDNIPMPIFEVPAATLGSRKLQRDLPIVIGMDFTRIREKSGHNIYGLLGMDFLHKWVVEIDLDHGELVLRKEAYQVQSSKCVEMFADKAGIPQVRCLIPGWGETDFEIDTGAISLDSGSLESRLFQYLARLGHMQVVGTGKSLTAAGIRDVRLGQATAIRLGQHQVATPIFSEGKSNRLSLNYLSRYNVTFDFPNERLYLSESKAFNKRDLRNLSGLYLMRKEGATVVEAVEAESAAEKAGIRAGDRILKAGDLDVDHTRMHELKRLFSQEAESLKVVVSRNGRQLEHIIDLK